tara:strand:+ start:222 stop:674 length:453 start_codon:yes stop_codon:yes gene_type:complete
MTSVLIVKHARGAPGLRMLGLGPDFQPSQGITKLQRLFDQHAFWARNRTKNDLQRMLAKSSVVITLWRNRRLVGFGRATSDEIYRAVLWDVVVADDLQGLGLGRIVVETLLESPKIRNVERVYLMTTNSSEFYEQMGFHISKNQQLLISN